MRGSHCASKAGTNNRQGIALSRHSQITLKRYHNQNFLQKQSKGSEKPANDGTTQCTRKQNTTLLN